MRQFAERARRDLREGMPQSSLIDSIPRMLDVLVDLLRTGPPVRAPDEAPRVVAIAWAHGAERAATEVDVVQMVWEYGVLRDILLDEAERAGAELTVRDVRVLTDVITTGIAESVRKFTADRAAALRRTEARFLTIADHAPAAFVIKSAEGRLLFVNRFACESLGRKRSDLVGRLDREVLPPAAAARQAETDARAHGYLTHRCVIKALGDEETLSCILDASQQPKRKTYPCNIGKVIGKQQTIGWHR